MQMLCCNWAYPRSAEIPQQVTALHACAAIFMTKARITKYVVHDAHMHRFYPIVPGHEGIYIDYQRLEALEFPAKPHLLVMTSLLKQFAKPLPGYDAVFVNPGQFCRKQALGSCALVTIHPKPTPPERSETIDIVSRCRVDLVQF